MDPLLQSILDSVSDLPSEVPEEEEPSNPFPPKHNTPPRPPSVIGQAVAEVGGAAEAAATTGTAAIAGFAGMAGGISGVLAEATKVLAGKSPNIQKAYEDTSKYVREKFPVYEPKTKFGKDTSLGVSAVLEKLDLGLQDGVAWAVDNVTKFEGLAREKVTGKPFKVSPESDAINKALGYSVTSLVGITEIANLVRSGVKFTNNVKSDLLSKGVSKQAVEDAAVKADIFRNLTSENTIYKLGPDTRPIPKVVDDALVSYDSFKLTDEGIKYRDSFPENTHQYFKEQDNLKDVYETTNGLVEIETKYSKKYNDIPDTDITHVAGVLETIKEGVAPPYFMQNANPVVKRLFDIARDAKHTIDNTTESLLFGTGFKKGIVEATKEAKTSEGSLKDKFTYIMENTRLGISNLRESTTVPTEAGYLYKYTHLNTASRAKVARTLVEFSESKIPATTARASLKAKLDTKEYLAATDIIDLNKTLLGRANTAFTAFGKEPIKEPSWLYLPRPIGGNWTLRIFGPDKSTLVHKGFETEYQANKYLKDNYDLGKLGKEGYAILPKNKDLLPEDELFYSFLRFATDKEIPVTELSHKFLEQVSKNKSFIAARRARRTSWSEGYDYDPKYIKNDKELTAAFEKSILNYTRAMTRATIQPSVDKLFDNLTTHPGILEHYPNAVRLGGIFRDKTVGKKTSINEGIDKVVDGMATMVDRGTLGKVSPEILSKFSAKAQSLVSIMKLLVYAPGYMYANTVQPYIVAANYGAILQSRGLPNNITSSIIRAEKDLHLMPSKEAKDVMDYYMKDGRIATAGFFKQFSFEESVGKYAIESPGIKSKIKGIPTGQKAAIKLDQYTRAKAGLIFYHQLRDAGVSHEDAKITSGYMANHTMVDYSRAEKANIYDSKAGGVLGKFQSWAVNATAQNIQTYQELVKQMKMEKNPLVARDIGKLVAAKGFELSVVGASAGFGLHYMDKLMELAGSDYTVTESMNDSLPDWAMFGVPQAATGVQLSSFSSPDIMGFSTAVPSFYNEILEATRGVESEFTSWHTFAIKRALGSVEGQQDLLPLPEDIARLYKAWLPKNAHPFIDSWVSTGNPMFWDLDDDKLYPLASAKHKGYVLNNVSKNTFMKQLLGGMDIQDKRRLIEDLRILRLQEKADNKYDALVKRSVYYTEIGAPIPGPMINMVEDLRVSRNQFKRDIMKELEKGTIKSTWRMYNNNSLSPRAMRYAEEMFKKNSGWVKEMEQEVERTEFGVRKQVIEQMVGKRKGDEDFKKIMEDIGGVE